MNFLVTGGAGFIGSNIVDYLLKEGYFVRVLDNLSSGKRINLKEAKMNKNFEFIKGDIRDYKTCCKATNGIDCVLHQAALLSVPKSMDDPYSYNDVNISGTLNMLNASKFNKTRRFVLASSSSVYGETNVFPEREDSLPKLISPYALSKLASEYYCRIFSENYNLETVCLRYFNVFGPRQNMDDEYSVVIPKFINMMLSDKQPSVHGDGKQSRDFVFIDNVVEANILAATKNGLKCEVVNVANNKDIPILKLVQILNQIMGKSIKPLFTPKRLGDVQKTLADISLAEKVLGFKPVVDFETGLSLTVEWFKKQKR